MFFSFSQAERLNLVSPSLPCSRLCPPRLRVWRHGIFHSTPARPPRPAYLKECPNAVGLGWCFAMVRKKYETYSIEILRQYRKKVFNLPCEKEIQNSTKYRVADCPNFGKKYHENQTKHTCSFTHVASLTSFLIGCQVSLSSIEKQARTNEWKYVTMRKLVR